MLGHIFKYFGLYPSVTNRKKLEQSFLSGRVAELKKLNLFITKIIILLVITYFQYLERRSEKLLPVLQGNNLKF